MVGKPRQKSMLIRKRAHPFLYSFILKAKLHTGNLVLRLSNSYVNYRKCKLFTSNVTILGEIPIPFNVENLTLEIESWKDPQRNLYPHFAHKALETQRRDFMNICSQRRQGQEKRLGSNGVL